MQAPDPLFYFVLVFIISLAIGLFVNPDKGKSEKWTYWVIAPVLIVACSSLAFKSILSGIGFGSIAIVLLFAANFRYHMWR